MIGVEFQSCDIDEDNCVMMNNDGSRGQGWVMCGERKKGSEKRCGAKTDGGLPYKCRHCLSEWNQNSLKEVALRHRKNTEPEYPRRSGCGTMKNVE